MPLPSWTQLETYWVGFVLFFISLAFPGISYKEWLWLLDLTCSRISDSKHDAQVWDTRTRLSRSLEQATFRYLLEIFVIRDLHFLTFDLIGINDKRDSWIIFVIISVIFILVNKWATQLLQYVKIRCVSVKEYLRSFVTRETVRWFNGNEFLIERRPRITVEPPLKANSPERPPLYKGPFFSSRWTKIHTLTLVSNRSVILRLSPTQMTQ